MTLREQLTEKVGKGHLSYSSIKYALGDMRLWEMYMRGQLEKESDALVFGSLYDMLLFEKDKANEIYYVLDDADIIADIGGKYPRNTKRYKEWKEENSKKNADKTMVSAEDWKKANEMIERLDACGLLNTYLKGEYQVEFNEEIDGIPVKGFLDCLGDGFITDSKSARSVNKFRYDVNSWSYDVQAYIYTKVFGIKDYYWVVQEKAYPFYPALVKCSEETLFKGEMKFMEAVANINKWLKEGSPTNESYAEFIV
tara:strand:+ start:288 stop:1049 length:762 start_codon:yes stop_codon:yes gene_type:complete